MTTKTISPKNSAELQAALDETGAGKTYDTLVIEGNVLIDKPLKIWSGTTLQGNNCTLTLIDAAPKSIFSGDPDGAIVPIIGQKEASIRDVTIIGIEFFGNKDKQTVPHGKNYHNFIYFTNAINIIVKTCYIHDTHGDGIRIRNGKTVLVYNNMFFYLGHDGVHCRNCTDVIVMENIMRCRINSGARIINTSKAQIKGNYISGYAQEGKSEWTRGGPGIQIERNEYIDCLDIEVLDNRIEGTYGPGIYLANYATARVNVTETSVNIHNNIINQCGQNPDEINWVGGIVGSGWNVVIKDNTLFGNYRYGIAMMVGNTVQGTAPKATGYKIQVLNNIIANTKLGLWKTDEQTGYGVCNLHPSTHTVTCKKNDINGSAFGAFRGCDWDDSNINVDPLFADPGKDFHLQSVYGRYDGTGLISDKQTSPCIYAGGEIGRYNGTLEASNAGDVVEDPEPEPTGPEITEFMKPSIIISCDTVETLQKLVEALRITGDVDIAEVRVFNVPTGFVDGLDL